MKSHFCNFKEKLFQTKNNFNLKSNKEQINFVKEKTFFIKSIPVENQTY